MFINFFEWHLEELRGGYKKVKQCLPNSKERLFGLDLARAICALIIVAYHYACHTANEHKLFYVTKTSGWGDIAVTVFFIISGAALYYNYPTIVSIKEFWYKRWKSIFPMFYLGFIYFFVQNVFTAHTLFYGPSPWTLLLTVFGMDGYLLYRCPNYYLIGEWFLGAIILLYVLYPAILCLSKRKIMMPIILVAGYLLMFTTNLFIIPMFRNLFTCMASFYMGILAMKYSDVFFRNTIALLVSLGLFVWLTFFPFPFNIGKGGIILEQVHGTVFFILIVFCGEAIQRFRFSKVFSAISNLSFPVFLLHHRLIFQIQGVSDPLDLPGEICMIIVTILMTIICAKVLSVVNSAMLNSKIFHRMENRILQN